MLLFLFITRTNRCIEVSGRGVYKLEQIRTFLEQIRTFLEH